MNVRVGVNVGHLSEV